jgi:hypothetical protein
MTTTPGIVDNAAGLPRQWRDAIVGWAKADPRIDAVYLSGARAEGVADHDSPLELGIIVTDDPGRSPREYAVQRGEQIRAALKPYLPVPIYAEFSFPGDQVLTPLMQEHGTEIYRAGRRHRI